MATPEPIRTCLWFEGHAVEAAEFYVWLFPDSRIVDVSTVGAGPAKGNAFVVFELAGRTFQGIDGGPMSKVGELMSADPKRVMERLLTMGKIDIEGLREAGSRG